MKKQTYSLQCDMVFEPKQLDRFYMDLRAYDVKELDVPLNHEGAHLIWRGIYLAYQTQTGDGHRLPHGGEDFKNKLS